MNTQHATKNTPQTQLSARKVEQLTGAWLQLRPAEKATVYAMLKALRANTAGNTALAREWWEIVKLLSPEAAKTFEARVLP